MTWEVPVAIEDALRTATMTRVPAAVLAPAALAAAVMDRSRRYTSERERLAVPRSADGDLAARAVFFALADVAKIGLPLAELAGQGGLVDGPLHVVDVGAGAGAMSLGVLAFLHARGWRGPFVTTLLDRDARALAIGKEALSLAAVALQIPVEVTVIEGDVTRTPLPRGELVVVGTVLNELPPASAQALLERALVAARRAVLVLEPALRDTARALHGLRDAVLASGAATVLAPCTHAAPCPMLADPRDWCHEARPLRLPPQARAIAAATGLRDGDMKFSYLLLAPRGAPPLAVREGVRVVSEPLQLKGKLELFTCGTDGRRKLRLLDRHRGPGPGQVRAAVRGDELVLTPPPDERDAIAADVAVELRHVAGPNGS